MRQFGCQRSRAGRQPQRRRNSTGIVGRSNATGSRQEHGRDRTRSGSRRQPPPRTGPVERAVTAADRARRVRAAGGRAGMDWHPGGCARPAWRGREGRQAGPGPHRGRGVDHSKQARSPGPMATDRRGPAAAHRWCTADLLLRPGRPGVGRTLANRAGQRAGPERPDQAPGQDQAGLGRLRRPAGRSLGEPGSAPGARSRPDPGRTRHRGRRRVVHRELRRHRRSGGHRLPGLGPAGSGKTVRGVHRHVRAA